MEEQIKSIIQEKITFYGLMNLIFKNEPNVEFATVLKEMLSEDYFPFKDEGNEIDQLLQELKQTIAKFDGDVFGKMLKHEYYSLFVDPHMIRTSLWHSTYTNSEQLLFQEPNCQAKHFYAKYGFILEDDHLPGDHIATELEFLQRLAEKELLLLEEGNKEKFDIVLSDNLKFIDESILSWIDDLIQSLKENRSDFYIYFAQMIKEVVTFDKEIIRMMN